MLAMILKVDYSSEYHHL